MKPGDKIAIRASFVRERNLPFNHRGQPVSRMRIKDIGTITENLKDGKAVKVDWELLDPPRDWYLYTYRVTVVEADPKGEQARKLIVFAFAGAKHDFWLRQSYFAKKYGPEQKAATPEELFAPDPLETEEEAAEPSYTLDHIAEEGCFLSMEELAQILARAKPKKSLMLQGPAGTGKTCATEELPDFPSLVGRIPCYAVDRRLRRNFSRGYVQKEAVLMRVRGSIDVLETYAGDLL